MLRPGSIGKPGSNKRSFQIRNDLKEYEANNKTFIAGLRVLHKRFI
jgi:hypothetical protein